MINRKDLWLFVLILVVGAVVAFINPRFLSPINLSNTANLIGLFGIFAVAQAFVIISGGIELSVGSIIALLGVVFVDMVAGGTINPGLAFVIVVAIGCLIGLLHGFLVARVGLQPFVVTLCGLLIYRGVARWYTDDATAGFPFGASFPTLEWLTAGRLFGIPHSLIAFLLVTLIMGVVLHRSVFGRYLFAVGKNEEAARYSGICTPCVTIAAYVICCGLTAVAAIFIAMYTRSISPASHGNFYELYAIAAAVLGGCSLRGGEGTILGIVIGSAMMRIIDNGINMFQLPYVDGDGIRRIWRLNPNWTFIIVGSVILLAVVLDQVVHIVQAARRVRAVPARAEQQPQKAISA